MEHIEFISDMRYASKDGLLCAANRCHAAQLNIEGKIEALKDELKKQRDFERRLREKAEMPR